jgi:hypothetical protein
MNASVGPKPVQEQQSAPQEARRESTDLDCRYGKIGILSVAAAMRYASGGRNPADAPVAPRIDPRFAEHSA